MAITDLVFIDATGYHYSDYPSFLAWIQSQYHGIYGADVYLESDSQDGQFLAILAQAFYDTAAIGASCYNSFSPIGAQGTGLSRVVKINGLTRINSTNSTVDVTIIGTAGTVITNGIVQDVLSQQWLVPSPTTIPSGGTIDVTLTAVLPGAVQAQASTVNTIFTPTRGWQSVNNTAAATPGTGLESDAALRTRQSESTANPSVTVFDGTIGGVANLAGVTAVVGYENDTNATDGNSLPPHSIEIVVQGGDDMAICQEIALHKTPGTQTVGNTQETVFDSRGMPLIIYFQRPIDVVITVVLTISTNSAWSTDYEDLITQSLADTINAIGIGGTNGEVLISRMYAPAYLNGEIQGQSYTISSLEIGKNSNPPSTINIPIAFDELPICDPSTNITIVVT